MILGTRVKIAAVKTKLLPHQQRVVDRIQRDDQPGLIVYHGLGSGKTLTSIAAQDALNAPATVIAPAALQDNYKKEQAKHLDSAPATTLTSMQNVALKGMAPSNPLLIVDEAHRARDASSKTYKALSNSKNQKRILLTGSPFYNHPSDVASLINLASGQKLMPADKEEFSKQYITQETVNPGFIDRVFRGVKPGTVDKLNTAKAYELNHMFGKWVDYHKGNSDNFPKIERADIEVPMTAKQLDMYDTFIDEAPSWVKNKIKKGLPPNKQESKDLNAFATAIRQVSNSTREHDPNMHEEPKIEAAFQNMQKMLASNERAKGVVYSNYLGTGITPYKERLQKANIPFGEFSGDIKPKDRDQLVRDYNENKLKVLLLSSAGGEGLDLKGTRLMQVLEPHWNLEKIKQVEGRGARYKSHEGLPPEEQNMRIERYLATRSEKGLLEKMHWKNPGGSVDQYLSKLGKDKEDLINQFRGLMETKKEP